MVQLFQFEKKSFGKLKFEMKRFGIRLKPLYDMVHMKKIKMIWVGVKTKKSQILAFQKSLIKNLKVEMKKIQNRI